MLWVLCVNIILCFTYSSDSAPTANKHTQQRRHHEAHTQGVQRADTHHHSQNHEHQNYRKNQPEHLTHQHQHVNNRNSEYHNINQQSEIHLQRATNHVAHNHNNDYHNTNHHTGTHQEHKHQQPAYINNNEHIEGTRDHHKKQNHHNNQSEFSQNGAKENGSYIQVSGPYHNHTINTTPAPANSNTSGTGTHHNLLGSFKPKIDFIIRSPVIDCPDGQRRDRNGDCRTPFGK